MRDRGGKNNMQEIKAYKTTDEKIFEDKEKADQHQKELDFEEWFSNNPLYGNYAGNRVRFEDFVEYLKEHKEKILEYLQAKSPCFVISGLCEFRSEILYNDCISITDLSLSHKADLLQSLYQNMRNIILNEERKDDFDFIFRRSSDTTGGIFARIFITKVGGK
jgi:hypothetical protein